MAESVSHPSHYNQGHVECIEAIKSTLTPEQFEGFCCGNAIKYLWRYRMKGGSEDIAKAQTYIFWLRQLLKEREENEEYVDHYKGVKEDG